MPRSRFRPRDPDQVHARFERVKARALKRLDEEVQRLRASAQPVEGSEAEDEPGRSPPPRRKR